ncbi:DNA polymerase III subunit alpha [Rheinheimera sp. MMS21-TC3]|uniref:DNA polymerase III subunit alpha n=1 Tax=Rheinheimera sp. MMS21-TC3 TaxID=3072790 RepID=UPI0028C3D577|nr:DNA polymerase III subunit alpha [Rheinheimera sp. MMS21-TC3]WNO61994.1 DNA polymerase III subunit alpha [Rheinheimera sp. MMS21-TC3]
MAEPSFIHLRLHSDFSLVDGVAKVKPIVKAINQLKMPAVALTDQMNFCGLVRFYSAAHAAGVKPIIGVDCWVQHPGLGTETSRLLLLAADNTGYQNLCDLISKAYLRGHVAGKPQIDHDWLTEYASGVIVLSGAKDGTLGKALIKQNQPLVNELVAYYQQQFPNRFYLELCRTGRPDEELYIQQAVALAEQHQLPVVATNEVVFLKREDFAAHEIRVAIHDSFTLDDKRRPKLYSEQQYLRTEQEMQQLFADLPEALENSVEIAKRCNVTIRLGEYFLPAFPTGGMSDADFLVMKAQQGLEQRLQILFPDETIRQQRRGGYDERLQIELKVINQMGFPGYFLVVMEFIQWSKDQGIPVGPGRGSGAGSLVAYALKITDLDPLEYDLLFERFLNPERVSMPDFDVDFCMDRRDEVIEHVADMYGREAVSQIITFGTMAAKGVIRDVGRVLGHPYGFVERISKLVPMTPGMTLEQAFKEEPRLPELYAQDEEVKDLIDMARQLEGVTRNAGKHAGGVVIAPTKITDFSPLYCDEHGNNPVTQFDKDDVEYAGLVKFDFLGLRTLTILQWAVNMVNSRLTKEGKPLVDINHIPLVDKASFDLLQKADTTAVFQLESRGMKDLIRRLKPDCFEDIIALVALFRPGPLQSGMVDNFIDRKRGREAISYPDETWQHESLKPILEPTYGIILYQEQVMQIAQVLSGYSLGGADLLRRAMGKKQPEEMAKQRATFQEGAANNGIDPELAIKIFDLVEKFAGYGFNKSHSAAYALVSYQTLWMKTHFPAEFMAAVMSADMDNTDKIVTLVDECERMKLTLIPPDVNAGVHKFTVNEQGHIVYGIGAIKGVGEGPIEAIIAARKQHGAFSDLFDFCAKVDLKKVGKRVMEKLILAGALDKLGPHRAALAATLEQAMKAAEQHAKAQAVGQDDLFGLLSPEADDTSSAFVQVAPWPDEIWLEGEREALGLYLTGHPINRYLNELPRYASCRLNELQPTRKDQSVQVVGLVVSVRVIVNKKGRRWAIVTLDDKSARLDVRFFPDMLENFEELLQKDLILVITGQVSFDDFNGGLTMTGRDVSEITQVREKSLRCLNITVQSTQIDHNYLQQLQQVLSEYKAGTVPVNIRYQRQEGEVMLQLDTPWWVTPADALLHQLKQLATIELEFN